MSASVRFGVALFGAGLIVAALALGLVRWQRETRTRTMAEEATGGRIEAGTALIERYGCGACHKIPGIPASSGRVGPSLEGFAVRTEIAGLLANEPAELAFWLREPQTVKPGNGMPNQGITAIEARDIAAYLLTLN